ncbi:MAG: 50S ribosomal protein L19 [Candidatus Saccharimonadales bacterium]
MSTLLENFEKTYQKPQVADVRSGDTVRVHQRIVEGSKERVQVFEGVVIRTHRKSSLTATITVRRVASGIGVEKTFLTHAPNIENIEVVRRSKVRRNYLSYLRRRSGKSARLQEVGFDRAAAEVDEIVEASEQPGSDKK